MRPFLLPREKVADGLSADEEKKGNRPSRFLIRQASPATFPRGEGDDSSLSFAARIAASNCSVASRA